VDIPETKHEGFRPSLASTSCDPTVTRSPRTASVVGTRPFRVGAAQYADGVSTPPTVNESPLPQHVHRMADNLTSQGNLRFHLTIGHIAVT